MTIREQFYHIGNTRRFWLTKALGSPLDPEGRFYREVNGEWQPIEDLAEIRRKLDASGKAVAEHLDRAFRGETVFEQYENPVLFLQHMIWHEATTLRLSCWPSDWRDANPTRPGKTRTFGSHGGGSKPTKPRKEPKPP